MEWKEFKEIIPQERVVKIEPTVIVIGKLDFHSGDIDRYNFKVLFVRREKDVLWNNSMYAHGIITYDNGKSYPDCVGLCYTDMEELEKLAEPMRKAALMTREEIWEELRRY